MEKIEEVEKLLRKAERLSKMYGGKIYGQFGNRSSIVLYDIAERLKISVEWHYFPLNENSRIGKFISENYPSVRIEERADFESKIHAVGVLPTKDNRWCCQEFCTTKAGEVNLVGIRREKFTSGKVGKSTLDWRAERLKNSYKHINFDRFAEHTDSMVTCREGKDTIVVSPLLEWTDEEVENYLKIHALPYIEHPTICEGCPMSENS